MNNQAPMGFISGLILEGREHEEDNDNDRARELFEKALAESERLCGRTALITGYVMANLQTLYVKIGAADKARALEPRLKEIMQKYDCGPDVLRSWKSFRSLNGLQTEESS